LDLTATKQSPNMIANWVCAAFHSRGGHLPAEADVAQGSPACKFRHRDTGASETSSPMLADAEERITINRRAGELTISFSGDTNQAGQFARSVPDFVLKGRFADQVNLDLHALEQEMGIAVERTRAWWQRIFRH
jgi:hypothetical protein